MRESFASGSGSFKSIHCRTSRLLMAAAMAGITSAASATTYIGPGGSTLSPTTGDWNTAGNWSPTGIPSSSSTTELDFLGSSTYIATDDISGAFSLNILNVNGNGSSIAASGTNSLNFAGTNPVFNHSAGSVFTMAAPVSLASSTTVNQVAGGEIDFTGPVTGAGALTLSNSTGSGNSTVKLLGSNTFSGLVVKPNVTAVAALSSSTSTLGSGTVTLSGGVLQLQGQQLTGTTATQQIIPLQSSSFNTDVVYENAPGSSAGTVDGGSSLYENGYMGGTMGLPTTALNRTFQSSTGSPQGTYTGGAVFPTFQFQPYTSNNSMLVSGTTPSTLSLATATKMTRLEFLYTGSLPTVPVNVTLNFADGNTSTGTYSFTTQDWYSSQSSTALDAGSVGGGGTSIQNYSGNITEVDFSLTGTDATQPISSLTFTPTSNLGSAPKGLEIMALSGDAFTVGTAASQSYTNNLAVTANSSINVSGSLAATMGNLTIGANQLSVASSDATGTAYSLTLGAVTLTGTGTGTTTFDVAASSGSGIGTLNLGALNDGGTAQSITINPTGTGMVVLTANATSLVQGTTVNILGGTLDSSTASSLGSLATVNVALPGTFEVGASQTISALNGSTGSVSLGSNTLTVGSTDNLSSSFGGSISGTGVITKAGTGTLTLSGSSTFTGSAVNTSGLGGNGANLPASTIINAGTVVVTASSNVSNGTIVSSPLGTSGVLVNTGTTLLIGNTPGLTVANPLYGTSSGSAPSTFGGLNTTGVTTFSGNLTLGSGTSGDNSHNAIVGATAGGEVDFTGNILANSTTGYLSKVTVSNLSGSGSATVRFTGNNTYNGGTTVNPNVTLAVGPSAYSTEFGTGNVTLAGGRVALQGVLPTGTQQIIPVSGFNANTIVDAAAPYANQTSTGTPTSYIGSGLVYFQDGYQGNTTNGLPASGAITSALTGHGFQLAPFTGYNTLRYTSPGSQTLTLATPGQYQTLDFLATSQSTSTFSVTLNFSGGGSATVGGFTTADWYGGSAATNAVTNLDPAQQDNGGTPSNYIYTNYGGALTIGEYDVPIPAADQGLSIASITLDATAVNGNSTNVYAVSGATVASATPLPAQTFANSFVMSANSTIDVSGSLNATIGSFNMGSQTLTVTSSDTSGSSYSLTTGSVLFVSNAPSFNVSNSAGNGAGSLILGSLNDQGAKQTLTKYGTGTLVLGAAATQVTDGSLYNIAAGTLASNNANAMTYTDGSGHLNLVGISVANGATFSIGASQAIDNLNDFGTPVVNGSTVALNGYNLSIGSIHDRNSTFSGSITDGNGSGSGLIKNGAGTLTLYGASTYSGPTAVNFGTLLVANTTGSATGSGNVTLNQSTLASGTVGNISGNVLTGSTYYTIAPGGVGSIGTLAIGGITTSYFTTLNFDLGSGSGVVTNGDLLVLGSGTVSVANGTVITLGSNPSTLGTDYRLIGGNISGINLNNLTVNATPPTGDAYTLSTTVDPGYIDLVVGTSGPVSLLWDKLPGSTGDGTTWQNNPGGTDAGQNWNNSGTASSFTTGDAVTFTDVNAGNYNVTVASNVLPASVTVNAAGTYNISGGFAIGNVPSGITPLTQSGGGLLNISNVNTFTGATNISGSGTTLHLLDTGSLATASVTVGSGSILNLDGLLTNTPAVVVSGTINLGGSDVNNDPTAGYLVRTWSSLNISSGAKVVFKPATSTSTRTVLVTSLASNLGKIDLSSNDMIIENASMGTVSTAGSIANQIASGFNNGAWNGSTGITSSAAASNTTHLTAIGYKPGGSTFDGISTTSSEILVKYTYYGDANLSGSVDGSDYSLIDNGYLEHLTGWYNGDFNYDGVVNGSDYTLIDNAFNSQGTSLAAEIASPTAEPTAQLAGSSSAVPEPASLGLLVIGAAGLLGRRKRRI